MRDTSFFQSILNLGDSWKVTSLDCDEETKTIRIRVEFVRDSKFPYQSCGQLSLSVYDHREREWRHLNIFEYRCYLVGDIPRIMCSRCGVARQVKIPWSEPHIREVAHTMKRHLEGIITYETYRITNNYVERMNNKIKAIVHKAYGFRTTRCFKNAILFHCGKLDYSILPTHGIVAENFNSLCVG